MDEKMTIEVTKYEALLIVTALGVMKDRVGQKGSWLERKRLPTLRSRLADCMIIGDAEGASDVRKALRKTKKRWRRLVAAGINLGVLMRRVKELTGITDEHFADDDDAENENETENNE